MRISWYGRSRLGRLKYGELRGGRTDPLRELDANGFASSIDPDESMSAYVRLHFLWPPEASVWPTTAD